ncbi:amidohydrolase family protein [Cohnella terricola]|uniref:Amidohydrolase n=1 Tax=Cohnella terricola TaxID=1289167 RepID=A0A559JT54_9BACL|nr:amidohydrolase family protein [Cohnella terricola]TVY03051.1 amidohydrolase [Cohnella terricola]
MFRAGFQVFDIHGHLPFSSTLGRERHDKVVQYGKERSERMRLSWDLRAAESDPEQTGRPLVERWKDELDRYGIGGLNFLTGKTNEELAEQIKDYPDRFTGFASHPIDRPGAAEELRRAVNDLGLKGYKLFGPLTQIPFGDPSLTPVWTFLAERQLPVLIHFGMLGHAGGIVQHLNINPLSIFNVAANYPDIPIIVPHFGCGYFQELLQLCWSCPNVYVDTSGSNQWIRWVPYELTLETLFRKTYELIGPERIVFGSDSMSFPRGYNYRYLQDQIRTVRDLRLAEPEIEAIFGNNARKLLNLEPSLPISEIKENVRS